MSVKTRKKKIVRRKLSLKKSSAKFTEPKKRKKAKTKKKKSTRSSVKQVKGECLLTADGHKIVKNHIYYFCQDTLHSSKISRNAPRFVKVKIKKLPTDNKVDDRVVCSVVGGRIEYSLDPRDVSEVSDSSQGFLVKDISEAVAWKHRQLQMYIQHYLDLLYGSVDDLGL